MLRALVKLTTGVELGGAALAVFIGVSLAMLVSVGIETANLLIETIVIASTVGVVVLIGMGVWRRYRRLFQGKCGHMACHGAVASDEKIPEHLVMCSNCKWVWPRVGESQVTPTVDVTS